MGLTILDPQTQAALGTPGIDTDEVTDITPDEVDPSFAIVTFSDGRRETMPTSQAQALPQAAPMGPPVAYPAQQGPEMGPPPAPPPVGPAVAPAPEAEEPITDPMTGQVVGGVAPGLGTTSDPPNKPVPLGQAPAPRVDPNAQVVGDVPLGSETPGGRTDSSMVETPTYAMDPLDAADQAGSAYDAAATDADELDLAQRRGTEAELAVQEEGNRQAQVELAKRMRTAELVVEEKEALVKALEDTSLDDDWTQGSWGRQIGAWAALALSGFLQGATKGANPALNQMMAALNQQQQRFVDAQMANRNSKLSRRIKALGDAEQARDTLRMQFPGLIQKQWELAARRAGISELPPGLTTAGAKMRLDGEEAKQRVYARVVRRAEERASQEFKAAPAGPVFAGDVALRRLGMDKESINKALDPKDGNLGSLVTGAQDLELSASVLEEMFRRYGEQLPNQEVLEIDGTWLGKKLAQMGNQEAIDSKQVQQMLERAMLASKQTMNIKSIDSENEGKSFRLTIDTGTSAETVAAVRHLADNARSSAISSAARYTRNPQGLIDYVAGTQANNVGPRNPQTAIPGERVVRPPTEEDTLKATGAVGTGEAPAPLPKAEPAPTGSRRGTYRRLRESKPDEPR